MAASDRALVELDVEGMHCAACAVRVESQLNKLDGVEASVSIATEKATVHFAPEKLDVARLIRQVRESGYDAQVAQAGMLRDHRAEHRAALREFLIAALLSAPFLLEMGAMFAGRHGLLPGALQFLLATPVQFWCGWRFYRGAFVALRGGGANMDVLVALGTSSAYLYSATVLLLAAPAHLYFEASAMVITLVLLGKYLEARAKAKAAQALEALVRLQPKTAWVERDGRLVEVEVAGLAPGDAFVARPGDVIALDGRVLEGETEVNESMLTGESMPVEKRAGSRVFAGTLNGMRAVKCVATGIGKETVLSGIIRMVAAAQASKPPVQRLVDRVSAVFVPVVAAIAALTFGVWWFVTGAFGDALVPAVAVLVIACPCALGLATPTALMVGVGRAARAGILIRNASALEGAERIDRLVFDKTGTLTLGEPAVTDVLPEGQVSRAELLRVAAALESRSEHPLARAVMRAVDGAPEPVEGFTAHGGRGVSATLRGKPARLGSPAFLGREPPPLEGRTVLGVEHDGAFLGWIGLADELRPSTPAALARLARMNVEPIVLSGDNPAAVKAVAERLGIRNWQGGVLPQGKADEIAKLQRDGFRVAMAGDGVNDAPALARADVSFALAGGTGVAIDTADVTLMKNDLAGISDAIELSRATLSKIRQNLFFAFVYNVLGIPLAALGLLNPVIAGLAMALSSVSVVSNSLLLNRWKSSR